VSAEFLALLQPSVSHDPSEIIVICWFAAEEKMIIIENSFAAWYLTGNLYFLVCFQDFQDSSMNRKIKTAFNWEDQNLYKIINVFPLNFWSV